jgi:hypothetical protein
VTEAAEALRAVVVEVEAHVSQAGWDAPPQLFALVPTRELALAEPALAAELGVIDRDAAAYTPVEQEIDDESADIESLLTRISWPPAVHGAVVVTERVVLPSHVEDDVPTDREAASDFAARHRDREDVRIAVGALRSGEAHCVLRLRSQDSDGALVQGKDVVPALVSAVRETLEVDADGACGWTTNSRGDG